MKTVLWCAWCLLNIAVIGFVVVFWQNCPYVWLNIFGTTLIASGFLAAWGIIVALSREI